MKTIEFVTTVVLQDEHRYTDKATRYKEGQRLQCSEASAAHWINRGLAKLVTEKPSEDKPRRGRPPKVKSDA